MADPREYDHTQYRSGKVYPLHNRIKKGYGVADPDRNPAAKGANARLTNQRNEKIDFWVEEVEAKFEMTGTTAQSRTLRQFVPHSIVQPSIMVTGRAPNSFQYNRLASFIRASHWNAVNMDQLSGEDVRHEVLGNGKTVTVPTIRLIIRNRTRDGFPYNGSNVKGSHIPWAVEGYVKSIKAGAKRHDPAPPFQFEFLISENLMKPSLALWNDTRVYGSQLRAWLDFINKDGSYVTINEKDAMQRDPREERSNDRGFSPDEDPFEIPDIGGYRGTSDFLD